MLKQEYYTFRQCGTLLTFSGENTMEFIQTEDVTCLLISNEKLFVS